MDDFDLEKAAETACRDAFRRMRESRDRAEQMSQLDALSHGVIGAVRRGGVMPTKPRYRVPAGRRVVEAV